MWILVKDMWSMFQQLDCKIDLMDGEKIIL
jgi:hypothetical protein